MKQKQLNFKKNPVAVYLTTWYKCQERRQYTDALIHNDITALKKLCRCKNDILCPACRIIKLRKEYDVNGKNEKNKRMKKMDTLELINKCKNHFPAMSRLSAMGLKDGHAILKEFMTEKPIKTAIEIGTYKGLTTAVMSLFAEQVITIDVPDGLVEARGIIDPMRQEVWDYLGIKNITLKIFNNKQKANFLNSIEFDFAFIDGDHIDGFKLDFELTKKCGRVLFHDYDDRPAPQIPYVKNFVDTLPKNELTIKDVFAYWKPYLPPNSL